MVPNWEWYRSGTLLWAAVLNLKMLTLIFARDHCRVSYGVQPGGVRNLCDGAAGEFHELGGFSKG